MGRPPVLHADRLRRRLGGARARGGGPRPGRHRRRPGARPRPDARRTARSRSTASAGPSDRRLDRAAITDGRHRHALRRTTRPLADEPSGDPPADRRGPSPRLRVAGGLEAGEQAELRVGRVSRRARRAAGRAAEHHRLGPPRRADRGRRRSGHGGRPRLAQRHVARRPPGRGADARAARIGAAPRRGPPRRRRRRWTTARPRWPSPAPPDRPRCRSTAHPALRPRPPSDPVEPPTAAGDPRPTAPGRRRLGRRADRHGPRHGRRVRLAAVRPVRAAQPGRPPRDRAREPAARPPRRAPRPAAVRPGAGGLPHDPRGAGRRRTRAARRRRCPTRPRSCAGPPPRAPVCGSGAATTPTRCTSGWGSDRCRGTRRSRRAAGGTRPRSPRRDRRRRRPARRAGRPGPLGGSRGRRRRPPGRRAGRGAEPGAAGRDPPRSRRPRPRRRGVRRPRDRLGLGEVAARTRSTRAARARRRLAADRDERRPALPGDARRGRRRAAPRRARRRGRDRGPAGAGAVRAPPGRGGRDRGRRHRRPPAGALLDGGRAARRRRHRRVHRVGRGEVVDDVLAAGVTDATARRAARALARFDDPELEVAGAGLPAGRRPAPAARPRPTHPRRPARPVGGGRAPIPTCSPRSASPRTGCSRSTSSGTVRTRWSPAPPARARASCCARSSPGSPRRARPTTSPSCWSTSRAAAPSTGAPGCPTPSGSSPTSTRTWRSGRSAASRPSCATASASCGPRARPTSTEHRRRPGQGPPLPRLVVVVDEFATLKAELPDFVESLVGVAQRGRSLGVHLVLATQRPSGAVSENIRANTNLRIALRVQDAADSTDVIDRPDAARIGREPARAGARPARARRGRARSRPRWRPASRRPVTGRWRSARSGSGRARRRSPPPTGFAGSDAVTDLQRLVDAAVEAHRRSGRPRPGGRGRTRCRPRSTSTRSTRPLRPGRGLRRTGHGGAGRAGRRSRRADPVPGGLGAGRRQPAAPRHPGQRHHDRVRVARARPGRPGRVPTTSTCTCSTWAPASSPPLAALPHVGSVVGAGTSASARPGWSGGCGPSSTAGGAGTAGTAARPARGSWSCSTASAAFRAEWEDSLHGVWEDLQRVFADGPEVGVHTVVDGRPVGRGARCDAVAGPAAVAVPDGRCRSSCPRSGCGPATSPISDRGGRVVAERTQEVQVARPAERARRRGRRAWPPTVADPEPARRPVAIGVLPAEVDPADLVGGGAGRRRPVDHPGRASPMRRWRPATLVLHEGEHALVAGPSRSGRTSLLHRDRLAGPGRLPPRPPSSPWPATARPWRAPAAVDRVLAPEAGLGRPRSGLGAGPVPSWCWSTTPTCWRTTTAPSAPFWPPGGPTCTWWPPAATRRCGPRTATGRGRVRAGRAGGAAPARPRPRRRPGRHDPPAPLDRGPHAGPRLPVVRRRARLGADHGFTRN